MDHHLRLLEEHRDVTRRYFLQLGAAGMAGLAVSPLRARDAESDPLLGQAWLEKAASSGNQEAVRRRDHHARELSSAQLAEARALARQLQ